MANVTDKITDTRNAARPNSARVTSPRSAGGTTLSCDNLSGWPIASKVHFVTYTVDSNSKPVPGTQLDCYGIVSSNTITQLTVIDGNDTGNVVADYVEMLPTAAWGQDLSDGLNVSHNRDGTPKSGITYPTSMFVTPTITDFTNANHDHSTTEKGGQLPATALSEDSSWSWQSWTPTWTNVTIGNATVAGRYTQIGKKITARLSVIWGSTTTATASQIIFSLPVTAASYPGTPNISLIGYGLMYDTSASQTYDGNLTFVSSTTAGVLVKPANGTWVTFFNANGTNPATWVSPDEWNFTLIYEAA